MVHKESTYYERQHRSLRTEQRYCGASTSMRVDRQLR